MESVKQQQVSNERGVYISNCKYKECTFWMQHSTTNGSALQQ